MTTYLFDDKRHDLILEQTQHNIQVNTVAISRREILISSNAQTA